MWTAAPTKCLPIGKEKIRNETRLKNYNVCSCLIFDCYYQKLISAQQNGYWVVSPTIFEIFLIFPYSFLPYFGS